MRGRNRQASTGALWVFAPVAGNWGTLGYQRLSHTSVNGKTGTEFGNGFIFIIVFSRCDSFDWRVISAAETLPRKRCSIFNHLQHFGRSGL